MFVKLQHRSTAIFGKSVQYLLICVDFRAVPPDNSVLVDSAIHAANGKIKTNYFSNPRS